MKYLIFLIPALCINQSFAGGLDVNNLWSAKYNAMGAAAVSNVEGAQSLYFNPAGLTRSKNVEFDENIVTGFVRKTAPLVSNGVSPTQGTTSVESSIIYTPIVGFFWAHRLSEKWGMGMGAFVAGGSGGKFDSVDFGSAFPTLRPNLDSALVLLEFAAGIAYEIVPGLSVGAAWRPTYLKLDTKAAVPFDANMDGVPDALIAPELNASDFLLNSFRFGVQYQPDGEGWGVGASFRTEVDFKAKGTSSGSSELTGSSTVDTIQGGNIVASGKVPMQLAFGAHCDFSKDFRFMVQYNFTQNSRDQNLNLSGSPLTVNGIGAIPAAALSTPLKWKDEHTIRVGAQYQASDIWVLRAGYVISSPTTPNEYASPFFVSPGSENTFDLGAGRPILLFGTSLNLDLALEYTRASGFGTNSAPGSLDGKYISEAAGIETALSYRY